MNRRKKFLRYAIKPVKPSLYGSKTRISNTHISKNMNRKHHENSHHYWHLPECLNQYQNNSTNTGNRRFDHNPNNSIDKLLYLHHVICDTSNNGGRVQTVYISYRKKLYVVIHDTAQLLPDCLVNTACITVLHHGADYPQSQQYMNVL